MHVWNEGVVLEPVGADYRPTPPGEPSHTVLVSNLANRVQPILRYDLGDSVCGLPHACPCKDPLPTIRLLNVHAPNSGCAGIAAVAAALTFEPEAQLLSVSWRARSS